MVERDHISISYVYTRDMKLLAELACSLSAPRLSLVDLNWAAGGLAEGIHGAAGLRT